MKNLGNFFEEESLKELKCLLDKYTLSSINCVKSGAEEIRYYLQNSGISEEIYLPLIEESRRENWKYFFSEKSKGKERKHYGEKALALSKAFNLRQKIKKK